MDTRVLQIEGLVSGYGKKVIITDLYLKIQSEQITTLIGRNGVGKTTLLNTIMGIITLMKGSVKYLGKEINKSKTHELVQSGISYVPQGKSIFPHMTVMEHLDIGSLTVQNKNEKQDKLNKIFELFPRLRERFKQKAGTLSGGERQMLSIGRALMSAPKLLILDEPSFGLAPNLVDGVFDSVQKINQEGVTILVVEQNAKKALSCSNYGYVMDMGKIIREGNSHDLLSDPTIKNAYLGDSAIRE